MLRNKLKLYIKYIYIPDCASVILCGVKPAGAGGLPGPFHGTGALQYTNIPNRQVSCHLNNHQITKQSISAIFDYASNTNMFTM